MMRQTTVRRSLAALAMAVGALATAIIPAAPAGAQAPRVRIDWASFLGRHDMVWDRLPTRWGESTFIGNGRIGATIDAQDNVLGWRINRTDVSHDAQRYPMGRVVLKTAGTTRSGTARLTLYDAEASGTLVTDRGEVRWRSFVSHSPEAIVIALTGTGGETDVDAEWVPAAARPPRKVARGEAFAAGDLHPAPAIVRTAAGITSVQAFLGGDAHAESIRRARGPGGERLVYIGIGWAQGQHTAPALTEATAATAAAVRMGLPALRRRHRARWHAFYPASFVSFPDERLEGYYWINVYKLGSAMREDGPILDLNGPWYRDTPWPAIWWNLNIQLTYSPLARANRMGLSESLFRNLDRHRQALIDNVPPQIRGEAAAIGRSSGPNLVRSVNLFTAQSDASHEAGNLPWTMFYYWHHYRYRMDDRILRDRVYPLLRRAIGNYLAYAHKGDDGKWHLPKTHSPELATLPDANYDLALLKWGLQTLIASAERLKIDDPSLPRWRDVLANLTPFPVDSTGLLVGRDRPWKESHRHYSHLLAIYPLALLRPDVPADRALIETSLQKWESVPSAFRGYSYTGGASMHAMLGNGDSALVRMNRYLDAPRYMEPNTFYAEAGPVIETPMSAVTSLQEFFLQDWGGALRVFPAMPTAWRSAAFHELRAEGAFLVSGVRHEGRTAWIRIESLAGQPCELVVPDWTSAVIRTRTGTTARVRKQGDRFVLTLAKGDAVVLAPTAALPLPDLVPAPLPAGQRSWPAIPRDSVSPASGRPQDAPELAWWRRSMQGRDQRLQWWRDARFGMFIHWGAYSHLAGIWEGAPVRGYAEHIQRIQKIPAAVYRERAVSRFDPHGFDADEWMRRAKAAGMGYVVITAKHHDGFAMYESDVSDYDIVDATPFRRDPMRELRDAARKHGIRFGFYYSHAFDWGDPEGPGNDWEHENPGGDRNLHGGREWWAQSPQLVARAKRYVDRKAIPQVRELVRRYDPDIMWFDTPHKLRPEENLRILRAVREAKPDIVINGRAVQVVPNGPEARFGDYMNTADRPAELWHPEGDWEAIPTTNESYGHHLGDSSHKPASHFVQLLARAAARGGNLLMNIGPMGDGRFDPRDTTILSGIGSWMQRNGESIRGTTKTPLPVQAWGESTRKGNRLYLHVFEWPRDGRLRVAGLQSDVFRAYLLGDPATPLRVRRVSPSDIEVAVPAGAPDRWSSVVVLDAGVPMEVDPAVYVPARGAATRLHVFDGTLVGRGIRYGDGKRGNDVTQEWNRTDSGVDWTVRVDTPARFRLSLEYATGTPGDSGVVAVTAGSLHLAAPVQPSPRASAIAEHIIGELALPVGTTTLRVRPVALGGTELMRLRRVVLTPIAE